MSTLDDTRELRRVAQEIYEERTRPTDVGAIVLTAVVVAAIAVWALPIVDTDRYDVSASRWVLAAAMALSAIAGSTGGVYFLDRRGKKRYDEVVANMETMRYIVCHNATMLGQLAEALLPEPEQVPIDQVHAMNAEAYRLGRRSRPADGG